MRPHRLHIAIPLTVVVAGLSGSPITDSEVGAEAETQDDAVILVAGDIAKCSSSADEATAALLSAHPEATILTVGDHVYPDGTLAQFTSCYGPSWGQHRPRTRPAPGNHEYRTTGAAGYFDYFGAAAGERGKGYYAYDLGAWRVVVLNSNCALVGGCEDGSAQMLWLRADLAANSRACTLAYWHHPRFTSTAATTSKVQPLWQALHEAGADVVLGGHAHNYERFAPQDPTGKADPRGMTQFVVGTGGASHEAFTTIQPNSMVRDNTTFGVLRMTLKAASYDWQFQPVAGGSFTDSGTSECALGTPPPPPPANLLKNPSFEQDGNADGRPDSWTSNAKFTRSTAAAPHNGTYVGRHQAADTATRKYTISQTVPSLLAGAPYRLSGWVSIPPTSDTFSFQLSITWRTASNAVIGTTTIQTYTGSTDGTWGLAEATVSAPANTTNAQVQMIAVGLAGTIYVDDFALARAP
jgi:hypothetical protein